MIESFITAFIIYFVVIDPVGNAPVFLAVTTAQTRRQKFRTAIEATMFASFIMLFFALCGAWVLAYLKITQPAFKIAGGIILFLVSLDMLSARRQQRKRDESTDNEGDNLAIYPLDIPMLAGPAAIISVIVLTAEFSDALGRSLIGYSALLAVMASTGLILCLTVIAESWLNEKVTMVFSRITAIILAGLSVQYVLDGLLVLK
ncbi:MAG: MarC family protein [Candidatus Puniceispirillaceae bacterium]